ncbi:hypothetical protein AN391_03190 [Pseudoalteromonas sp. P1-13-1a]|uniref:tRNA (adenine(22)-N(1))-methyltransferase n=1 Tax=Pseudoalteromonas sp. P1-13-1a TaxID=1723756 RepID=UPI0006D65C60|nr:tRNA (adenine(22)-N(1))-methyltransferase TrmK [Pseudoalteromonas sp. P1-13-1a]KPZ53896.1 hypothetical protein AN391_03190 [Pseudoalteromonas sp. P1-13-1a]
MKLSKRLNAINALITNPVDVIWDCCCDHGYLGIALLKRRAAKQVNFVDVVDKIMAELSEHLVNISQTLPSDVQYEVFCQDVREIKLVPNELNTVVIAGVGGELMLKLVAGIIKNNCAASVASTRFIVCPIHHTYHLRSGLAKLGFGLESEQLITENNRYYELIEISQRSATLLTSTGNSMWDLNNALHRQYLKQLLTHYNNMLNKDELYYQKVITGYKNLSGA